MIKLEHLNCGRCKEYRALTIYDLIRRTQNQLEDKALIDIAIYNCKENVNNFAIQMI